MSEIEWVSISKNMMEGNNFWAQVEQHQEGVKKCQEASTKCLEAAVSDISQKAILEGEIPEVEIILYKSTIVGFELNYTKLNTTKYFYIGMGELQDGKNNKIEKAIYDANERRNAPRTGV